MTTISDPRQDKRTEESVPKASGSWLSPAVLGGYIVLLLLVTCPGVVFGTQSFFYRDFGLFSYPVANYHRESFWHGEVPLWNPLSNFGIPFLAQWNTMALYPFSLFYMVLPMPWALNIFCLAHLVLAGVSMYFLANRWVGNRLAASVAGLVFAWNGLSVHSIMWTSNLAALAWMPLVILLVERAWREGGRRIFGAALVGGIQMLTGSPEIILLTWLVLAVMFIGEAWHKPQGMVVSLKRLCGMILMVAGLSAAQILPFLDLLLHSERNSSFSNNAWAMPVWGWANFVVPLFHSSPSMMGVFSQDEQQWTSSYYMGIGVLALACMAVWRCRQQRVYLLAFLAVAGVILSMGENTVIYQGIRKVFPAVGVMRYPIKLVVLPVFALPLLAAFGLARFQNQETESKSVNRGLAGVCLLIAALIGGILFLAYRHPHTGDLFRVTLENGVIRFVFLVLICGGVFLTLRPRTPRMRMLCEAAILLLIGLDALTHTPKQNPAVTRDAYGDIGMKEMLRARPGESRAMLSPQAQTFLNQAATPDPTTYFLGFRRAQFLNANLMDGIPGVTGFFSVYLKESATIHNLFYQNTGQMHERLADFLSASQISSPTNVFGWVERSGFMPMITAGQRPVIADEEQTLKVLRSDDWNPRQVVFLPPTAKGMINSTNASKVNIKGQRFSAHEVSFEADASESAMVVISQAFYHPWHAYVDDKPAQLFRANHAFQALEIPGGNHKVRLVYQDQAFRAGALISLVSTVVCLVPCFVGWVKRRSQVSTA
jgi:hypothetical protein